MTRPSSGRALGETAAIHDGDPEGRWPPTPFSSWIGRLTVLSHNCPKNLEGRDKPFTSVGLREFLVLTGFQVWELVLYHVT